MQRTFTILKPDSVAAGDAGAIISRLEKEGFRIVAMKRVHLTEKQAQGFYFVHKERPFFGSLVKFMSEGPIIPMVLEAENAIEKLRKVMGATDPAKADAGTIRKEFATNIERNAIHGSDGPETAAFEISYFFSQLELVG
jgi:nucleoside-diphosphate kinase